MPRIVCINQGKRPSGVYFFAANSNMERRKTISKRCLGSASIPEVGIFWFIQQPGTPPRLLRFGVSIENAERYGDYLNHPGEHSRYWPDIKRRLSTFFHDSEPKDWPRGRVIYNTRTQRFAVFLHAQ